MSWWREGQQVERELAIIWRWAIHSGCYVAAWHELDACDEIEEQWWARREGLA